MKKILVVDDSAAETLLIEQLLRSAGYVPLVVNDPLQAESVVSAQRPDLVLLDVVMPKRNGFQVCRDLRQNPEHGNVPILVVTSKNSDSDRYWAKQQGANGYLTKPFTEQELLTEVSKLLR